MKQPRKLTFADMRRIIENSDVDGGGKLYIERDFGIGIGVTSIMHRLIKIGEPLVIDDNRIGIFLRGEADVTVNLMDYKVKAGTVAFLGKGSIVQINGMSDDSMLEGMIFNGDFLNVALHGRLPQSFGGERLNFYKQVDSEELSIIDRLIHTVWDIAHQRNHNIETISGIVSALVYFYDSLNVVEQGTDTAVRLREREIFERFITLVNSQAGQEHSMSFFADKMCLSERYLGTVVRRASGTTAKAWIDRATITAAKVMLRHTDSQVVQISDTLKFPNSSFFCKFFRRLTGITPMEYRCGK